MPSKSLLKKKHCSTPCSMSRREGKPENVDLEFDLSISSLIVSCNGFLEIIHQCDMMKISMSLWLRPKMRLRSYSIERDLWVNVWKAWDPLNKCSLV